MHIKSVTLINFQQHKNLSVSFSSGVNYIVGPSGAGKSTILRAISFVLFGEPRSDDIRKDGEKITSVKIILDTDIEITRIKSASINRIIIKKGSEEKVYDSIGAEYPEEIKNILQVRTLTIEKEDINLNIAEQIALPFLYDKPGSFRLKLFNQLSGADVIDKLISLMNKELLQFGRDIKTEQEFIETNEPTLKEVTIQHSEKASSLGNFKSLFEKIKSQVLTLQNLQKLNCSVKLNSDEIISTNTLLKGVKIVASEAIEALKAKIDTLLALRAYSASLDSLNVDSAATLKALGEIKIVDEDVIGKLKSLIDKHMTLDDLKGALDDNKQNLERVQVENLSIKMVDVDTAALSNKITKLSCLQLMKKNLSNSFDSIQETILKINDTTGNSKILDQQYQDLLKEAGVCPVCKRNTCEVSHE